MLSETRGRGGAASPCLGCDVGVPGDDDSIGGEVPLVLVYEPSANYMKCCLNPAAVGVQRPLVLGVTLVYRVMMTALAARCLWYLFVSRPIT